MRAPRPLVGPRAVGWAPTVALLGELLGAFGAAFDGRVSPRRARAARADLPEGEAYARLLAEERERARPVLEHLLPDVRALRRVLVEPDEYRKTWRFVVDEWNHAIKEHGWRTLPPLCEGCGRPVLVRDPRSFACCDEHRHRARAREHDAKKRAKKRAASARGRRGSRP